MPRHPLLRVLGVVLATVLALVGLALVATVGGAVYLARADLGSEAADLATSRLGREVSIDSLELDWESGIRIEIQGLEIANPDWAEEPHMLVVDQAIARIRPSSLLDDALRYERLQITGMELRLQRDQDGEGNWRFGDGGSSGGGMLVPKNRSQFPTLIDADVSNSLVTYETSSGSQLRIGLDDVHVASPSDEQPVTVQAEGSYNDVAAQIDGTTESFMAMRNAGKPFGVDFTIDTPDTTASFDGTLVQPLDFDGVDGRLVIDAADTGDLAEMFRAEIGLTFPLEIAGHFTRQGNEWHLQGAEGAVAGSSYTGTLHLTELGRGQRDDVTATFDFAELDLGPLLPTDQGGGNLSTPIALSEPLGIDLDADLHAGTLVYRGMRLPDVTLIGGLAGRQVTVETLSFGIAGGELTASGSSSPAEGAPHVSVTVALDAVNAAQLAQRFGGAQADISGEVNGRATLQMSGATLTEALPTSSGHAVVVMDDGRIAKSLLEKAATNVLSFFQQEGGSASIVCMLAIINVDDGVGRVPVLELRTTDTTLHGGGTVDLAELHIDMTFQTAPDSTGFFALDVPFKVVGPLISPSIEPQLGGSGPRVGEFKTADGQGAGLPPAMRQLVEDSDCQ